MPLADGGIETLDAGADDLDTGAPGTRPPAQEDDERE